MGGGGGGRGLGFGVDHRSVRGGEKFKEKQHCRKKVGGGGDKLENVGPTFFKITQMQSVSIFSICFHSCFSFLLLYFFYVIQHKMPSTCWEFWVLGNYIILRDIAPLINKNNGYALSAR